MSSSQATQPPAQASLSGRVPTLVLGKLIFFALALAILPIASYFLMVNWWFEGNSTYAGIFAGIVANVIVGAYITVAVLEEDANGPPGQYRVPVARPESKKEI